MGMYVCQFLFLLLSFVVQIIEVYRCVTCVCVCNSLCINSLKLMHADKDVDDETRKTMMRYPRAACIGIKYVQFDQTETNNKLNCVPLLVHAYTHIQMYAHSLWIQQQQKYKNRVYIHMGVCCRSLLHVHVGLYALREEFYLMFSKAS